MDQRTMVSHRLGLVLAPAAALYIIGAVLDLSSAPDLSRRSVALIESIARPAHGADRVGAARAGESLAEPADMDVDRSLVHVGIAPPDPVEQLLAGEHPPWALHEEF